MTDDRNDAPELNSYFEAARADAPGADAAFLARVLADAETVQAGLAERAQKTARVPSRPGLMAVIRALGGWPAAAGLSTATLAGLWIGIAPPDALAVTAQTMLSNDAGYALDPGPGAGFFATEEAS